MKIQKNDKRHLGGFEFTNVFILTYIAEIFHLISILSCDDASRSSELPWVKSQGIKKRKIEIDRVPIHLLLFRSNPKMMQ